MLAAKAEAWKVEKLDKKFSRLQPIVIGTCMTHGHQKPGDDTFGLKLEEFAVSAVRNIPKIWIWG